MDINIAVAPNSQSAEVTLHISGIFNLWQNPTYLENSYWWSYRFWRNYFSVIVTESGYTPGSGKQQMEFRGKIKTDGSTSIDSYITFLIYPLHSDTFYNIECELILVDKEIGPENPIIFDSDTFSFRTTATVTAGHQTERGEDLTLKQKQENATYLYNNLVRKNIFTLESFACLLGLSDCTGDLNPTADYIYKIGEYDAHNKNNGYYGRMVGFIGKLTTGTIPDSFWWHGVKYQELTILQNGNTKCDPIIYGWPEWNYYGWWERDEPPYTRSGRTTTGFETWAYFMSVIMIPQRSESPTPYPPEDLKYIFAFGVIPVSHSLEYIKHLSGNRLIPNDDLYNFLNSNSWLTIETICNFYKIFANTTPGILYSIWRLSAEHQKQFSDLWRSYSTPKNFSKCRNNQIEKISEFMYWCFVDGDEGNFGRYNYFYQPFPPHSDVVILPPLYNLECVKKKARYWYDFFKKDRPWWPYFRWTI